MDKLICLIGEIGAGKTTIATHLKDEGLNYIQNYTDAKIQNKGMSIYIAKPFEIEDLKTISGLKVIVLYLKADKKSRLLRLRLMYRNTNEKMANILANVNSKIRRDSDMFNIIKCDYVINANRKVTDILHDINEIVRKF